MGLWVGSLFSCNVLLLSHHSNADQLSSFLLLWSWSIYSCFKVYASYFGLFQHTNLMIAVSRYFVYYQPSHAWIYVWNFHCVVWLWLKGIIWCSTIVLCFSDALMSQYSNSVSGYALACCFMLLKLALEYCLWVLLWTIYIIWSS